MSTNVTTWADGYGAWWSRVPDTPDARSVALEAIRAELAEREASFDPSSTSVEMIAPESGRFEPISGTLVFRETEAHPRRLGGTDEMCSGPLVPHISHMSGVPSLRCEECGFVSLDFEEGESATDFLAHLFEYEDCEECGKGADAHKAEMVLGNWFARCER